MKTLLITYCTEYEAGWGSRPDGVMIGKTMDAVMAHMTRTHEMGSYECFWRYDEPKEVFCNDEDYAKIESKMSEEGLAFYNEKDIKALNLLKKF